LDAAQTSDKGASRTSARALRIGIIGCGIGGLAAALFLRRDGHDAALFERFETPQPLGAGLLLQPTGQMALAQLGLLGEVSTLGARVDGLDGRSPTGRVILDLRYERYAPWAHGIGVQRGALFGTLYQAVLAAGIPITTGFEAREISPLDRPVISSADGRTAGPFDLVLIADGAHSALREALFPEAKARPYGWGAFWGLAADPEHAWDGALRQVYDKAKVMIGVLPVGREPGDNTNKISFFWSLKTADFAAARAEPIADWKARVRDYWPAAAPLLDSFTGWPDLFDASYRDVTVKNPLKGRVLMIGDAAHGMSPHLGQGANMALCDAWVLAHLLGRGHLDTDDALKCYVREREAHVWYYRLASRYLAPLFQSDGTVIPLLRDLFMGWSGRVPISSRAAHATLTGLRAGLIGDWRLPRA